MDPSKVYSQHLAWGRLERQNKREATDVRRRAGGSDLKSGALPSLSVVLLQGLGQAVSIPVGFEHCCFCVMASVSSCPGLMASPTSLGILFQGTQNPAAKQLGDYYRSWVLAAVSGT